MGQRRDRLDGRLAKAAITRQKNSMRKAAERGRREKDMLELIKNGSYPYTPNVMSWVSDRLGKKANQIESSEIDALVK